MSSSLRTTGSREICGMVAKRVCVLEAPWYRRCRPLRAADAQGFWQNPASLHLANYLADHNHRELDGHRFWEHTYHLAPAEWVLLLTLPSSPRGREMDCERGPTTSGSLHHASSSTVISTGNSARRCAFQIDRALDNCAKVLDHLHRLSHNPLRASGRIILALSRRGS